MVSTVEWETQQLDLVKALKAGNDALSALHEAMPIEEVEAHLKAHDAFQNLVSQQEEKVASLREHADKLIRQKHFDEEIGRAHV